MFLPHVKICGITRRQDALFCAAAGAGALGAVFYEKSPRHVAPAAVRKLFEGLDPQIARVGVFVNASVDAMLRTARIAALDVVQMHGEETAEKIEAVLREGFRVVQALKRTGPELLAAARALAHYVLLAEWGQVNPDLTAPIVEALLAEYERPLAALEVRRAALEAVSSANHPRIPDLIQDAYDDAPMDLQLSAIFAMGGSADRRWLPILHDEMGSSSPDFRAEAARAAGAIGASDSIDALEALLVDEDLEVAIAAVYALGQIGGDRVNELLLRLSEDPDFEELYDAIDEALEEMESLSGDFDLLSFAEDDDDDDLHDLRAN